MRILDRERYWNFLKAYVICFVALVGLYVVIDAFAKIDEFTERTDRTLELLAIMGRYYLVRMSVFYDQLCGVIAMMAAIFTVTWMQKNNELIAMLAAGISTQRVIRPVLVSAVLVSGLAVLNQEWILPKVAEEAQKPPDDDGIRKVLVFSRYDLNDVLIHGRDGDRATRSISPFNATLPVPVFGAIRELQARQAFYIGDDVGGAPFTGGWLLCGASLSPSKPDEVLEGPLLFRITPEQLQQFPPFIRNATKTFGARKRQMEGGVFFLKTNITFASLTRNRQWYQFAPTLDLIRALADPSNTADHTYMAVFLHARMLRPLMALNLLLLSLPLVLSGSGRNMFINLGLALGTSACFYGITFLMQYLGNNSVISPELAAWAPLIGFGTIASARWGTIRT